MNNIIILENNTRFYNNIPCYSNGDVYGFHEKIKYPFYTGEWLMLTAGTSVQEVIKDPVLIKNKTDLLLNMHHENIYVKKNINYILTNEKFKYLLE